jgi:hypothetical protein
MGIAFVPGYWQFERALRSAASVLFGGSRFIGKIIRLQ